MMLHGNKELETFKREEQLLLHNFQSPRQQQQRRPLRPGLHTRSQSLPKIDFDHHRLAATSADEPESSDVESAHPGHRRRTAIPRRTTTAAATAHARPTLHSLAAAGGAGSTRSDDDEGEGLTGDILPPIGDLSELLGEEGRRQIAELLAAELREEEKAKEKEKEKEAKPATSSTPTAPAPAPALVDGGAVLPATDHQMERERQEQEQRLMDLKARFHLASPAPLTRNNANTTPEEDAADGGGSAATSTATATTTTTSTALATHFPLPSSSLFAGDSSSSEEVLPDVSLSSSASHDIAADLVMLRRASLALPSPSLTATPESTPPTSLPSSLGPSPLTSPSTMRLSSSFSSLPLSRAPTAATKPPAKDV